jgi:hypothetical protein
MTTEAATETTWFGWGRLADRVPPPRRRGRRRRCAVRERLPVVFEDWSPAGSAPLLERWRRLRAEARRLGSGAVHDCLWSAVRAAPPLGAEVQAGGGSSLAAASPPPAGDLRGSAGTGEGHV